uniref:Uncharacterized protein n=1 Tax=Cacopsylla melanoneura TaxID=428564 RepID=A0A8D8TVN5_9HEMI
MNSLCVLLTGIIPFILIKGLSSYGPGTQDTTLPPNTTWLSSSEEEKIHFSQVDHVLNKYTLPGTVEKVLLNHTIIDPKGYKDRLELVKRFYRGRRQKFWNNKTKKWERYNQRVARVNEAVMDEIFAMKNLVNDTSDDFKFHESLAERKFAKKIDWYPEAHDVDIYEPDYSGDKIKDDYEVKRKKRGVNELDDNSS